MAILESLQLLIDASSAKAGANEFEQALQRVIAAEQASASQTERLDQVLNRLAATETKLGVGLDTVQKELVQQNAALVGLSSRFDALAAEIHQSVAAMKAMADTSARSSKAAADLDAKMRSLGGGSGNALGTLTRLAALFGTGLGIRQAVTTITGFDRALAQVGVIARTSANDLAAIRTQSAQLGATTEKSAAEAAQGALLLARAGFDAQKILGALPGVLDLSVAGMLSMAEAADITSQALAQFQLAAVEADRVTNALLVTASSSNTDVRQLAEGLKFAGSVAGAFGQDLESVTAAMGVLADRGFQGSLAGRALRGIFLDLRSPTIEARTELQLYGATLKDLDPRINSLADIADELGRAFKRGADAGKIFGAEQAGQAIVLSQSATKIRELIQRQEEWTTASREVGDALANTLGGALERLGGAFEGLVLQVGDAGLTGALKGTTNFITEAVNKLAGLEKTVGKFGLATDLAVRAVEVFGAALALQGGVKFLTFLGTALSRVGLFASALVSAEARAQLLNKALLLNPWTATIAGATALVVAYRSLSDAQEQIRHQFDDQIASAKAFAQALESVDKIQSRNPRRFDSRIQASSPETAAREDVQRLQDLQESAQAIRDALDPNRKVDLAFVFTGADELAKKVREIREELGKLTRFRRHERADTGAQAEIDALKTRIESIRSNPLQISDLVVVPARGLRDDFAKLGIGEAFDELIKRSEEFVGADIPGEFVIAADATELLTKRQRELAQETDAATDAFNKVIEPTKNYTVALSKASALLAADQEDLRNRAFLLASVENGTLALADAERIANQEREIRARTLQGVKAAEAENGALSDEAQRKITAEVRALVEQRGALDQKFQALRDVNKEERKVSDDGEKLVESFEKQALAMLQAIDPARELADALSELAKTEEPGSAMFEGLATRLQAAFATIEQATAQQERKRADDEAQKRVESDIKRAGDIVSALNLEAASYQQTRDAVEQLALAEELRGLAIDQASKDRIAAYQEEIQQLRKIREVSGDVAGGAGDFLRTLRDTGDSSEAGRAALSGVSDRLFERSIAGIEEQLTAALSSVLGGTVQMTLGDTAIVTAVNGVTAAIFATGGIGGGGGGGGGGAAGGGFIGPPVAGSSASSPGGFDFGAFGQSLAIGGLGILAGMLSRPRSRSGGNDDVYEVAPFERGGRGAGTNYTPSRVTNYFFSSPDRVPLTGRQSKNDPSRYWRR